MKISSMKATIVCGILTASAAMSIADSAPELKRIEILGDTLQVGGITGLLEAATANGWEAPWMPNRWHIENQIKDSEYIKVANAGREFGIKLARRLELDAPQFQNLLPEAELCELSHRLCSLSEWVSKPDGIGNLLLAGRSLDLASVGMGRLVANTNFPIVACEKLAAQVKVGEARLGVPRRAEILNAETSSTIFSDCQDQKTIRRIWEAGVRRNLRGRFLSSQEQGMRVPAMAFFEDNIVPTALLESRKSFFEKSPYPSPSTCLNLLTSGQNNEVAVAGVSSKTTEKALALLKFRKMVGYFPEKWVRSEAERILLENEIAEAAKWGRKITPHEKDTSFDPLKLAFKLAWNAKNTDKTDSLGYSSAVQAYEEIAAGCFFDTDTGYIRLKQEREERAKARADQK